MLSHLVQRKGSNIRLCVKSTAKLIRMVIGHEESLFKKGYCLGHPSDTYGTEISL